MQRSDPNLLTPENKTSSAKQEGLRSQKQPRDSEANTDEKEKRNIVVVVVQERRFNCKHSEGGGDVQLVQPVRRADSVDYFWSSCSYLRLHAPEHDPV
jgi:hypothetical protein